MPRRVTGSIGSAFKAAGSPRPTGDFGSSDPVGPAVAWPLPTPLVSQRATRIGVLGAKRLLRTGDSRRIPLRPRSMGVLNIAKRNITSQGETPKLQDRARWRESSAPCDAVRHRPGPGSQPNFVQKQRRLRAKPRVVLLLRRSAKKKAKVMQHTLGRGKDASHPGFTKPFLAKTRSPPIKTCDLGQPASCADEGESEPRPARSIPLRRGLGRVILLDADPRSSKPQSPFHKRL